MKKHSHEHGCKVSNYTRESKHFTQIFVAKILFFDINQRFMSAATMFSYALKPPRKTLKNNSLRLTT